MADFDMNVNSHSTTGSSFDGHVATENNLRGGLDMKNTMGGEITINTHSDTKMTGDRTQPLATLVLGDPLQPVTMTMQGNPEKPVASTTEILNLPRLTIDNLKELQTPKVRVRMPYYSQFCFKLFGN